MSKKLFVLVDVEDKEFEEEHGSYESLEDAQDELSHYHTDLKHFRIREYDLVKEFKLKLVTETVQIEKQVRKVVLK